MNFFADSFLFEDKEIRAKKYYDYFVDQFIVYQELNNHSGDISSVLQLPYCIFRDLITKQVIDRKKINELKRKEAAKKTLSHRKMGNPKRR